MIKDQEGDNVRKSRLMPAGHWDWPIPVPFSQGWLVDDLLFVGGQVSATEDGHVLAPGDNATQTRHTCEFIHKVLAEGGSDWPDLIKLNTWYDFSGRGPALKHYWEQMTKVRLEYLRDPGPAGTALRIAGLGIADLVIEIDAIAALNAEKVRLMPEGHWDWSIPVPLSQGWRVGDLIFVGGQVSADARGGTVAAGDIVAQTHNTYAYIGKVLEEAGADFKDLVQLNIFYRYDGPTPELTKYLDQIHTISREYLVAPHPSGITMRVNGLAYEGLLIEIEAIAAVGENRVPITLTDHWQWPDARPCSQAFRVGDLVFVSGQLSLEGDGEVVAANDIAAQTENVFTNLRRVLNAAGADMADLVKLYTFYYCDLQGPAVQDYWANMTRVRMRHLSSPGPVGTAIRVNGFAQDGILIEVQGIAALPD